MKRRRRLVCVAVFNLVQANLVYKLSVRVCVSCYAPSELYQLTDIEHKLTVDVNNFGLVFFKLNFGLDPKRLVASFALRPLKPLLHKLSVEELMCVYL